MKKNKKAFEKAKDLIKNNQYVKESDWSNAQPTPEDENEFIDRNGYEAFGEWHLGIHEEESEATKSKYGFPYGDLRRLHRSGLIAAKQRAAQHDYTVIEAAADELLEMLDDKIS